MEIFHSKDGSKDAAFKKWRDENPNGFFVNDKGKKGIMIHQFPCACIEFKVKLKRGLTFNPKICSMDKSELEEYAKRNNPIELAISTRCPTKQKN